MHPVGVVVTWLAVAGGAGTKAAPAAELVRGIYCNPGPALSNRVWGGYGDGYEVDSGEKHSGKTSYKCVNHTDADAHGGVQRVEFDQSELRPLVVAGWAKLEGVTGGADYHNSVYLDLRLKNGKAWPMKIAAFDPAKSGWQYVERIYTPPAPLASAQVYFFLRERRGTAWFDDLYVGEIIDDKGTRSENLLRDPGMEGETPGGTSYRREFFGKLTALGCNAFHFYKHVAWAKVMNNDPTQPLGPVPPPDPTDPTADFIADAHKRGFKVWVTVGLGLPKITSPKSPEFPFYPCVNNRWGLAYTRAIAYLAQYGFDGIGMVPDEWNYHNGAVKRWAKHPNPEVARFYAGLPWFCDCPVCRKKFKQQTGRSLPDLKHPWQTPTPVWAEFMRFRYASTAGWIRRSVEAAKKVKPDLVTDTMICVLPVCSDNRRETGAAWDLVGIRSGLDCLQTDPYILLHNYLGDSTHYYPTETAIHLAAANWKGTAGVTLEACRLRDTYRAKLPAEVYGAALSCLAHGATEFFWWHLNYLTGHSKFVSPETASRRVTAVYKVMTAMKDDLRNAEPPGEVLVVYSRASEDTWHWLAGLPQQYRNADTPLGDILGKSPNPRRGFLAHRNVLYALLRRGVPFQTTFLDNPNPRRLRVAKVLLVPFPFSLTEAQVQLLERQARERKTVVLFSELSPVDENGQPVIPPRLHRLLGSPPASPGGGIRTARLGAGRVVFLGRDAAMSLFRPQEPVKDRKTVVPLPSFVAHPAAVMDRVLTEALGHSPSLFADPPPVDVEAALLTGGKAPLLLLINWAAAQPAQVSLRRDCLQGAVRAAGYGILGDATVKVVSYDCARDPWTVDLAPQEARLLRLLR